ncbi:5'-methylthioadenosine/adenosylhomocysteine nucleosidase [uncultured Pseudacidovorax sp.]|uniref:5'-methylthioadenosine/adenosylhomocysteine nucleosidase n=1 Tax=uncultured Pseudacidovorax sp. TaxID=679313 RepID=UPI0025E70A24|nr:5'-methylthioadenosine/adenosylhomocysteine nucleosidase [uncultured Pseudacidovorax sp.]
MRVSAAEDAPIAIVGAMQEELAAVLAAMPDEQPERIAGREFWRGHLEGRPVVVVLSRIGKVAAATTATVLLARYGVRAVLFTGVAGGLGDGVAVGDVVVAHELLQHDMDASPLFPRHEVPLTGMARFPADGPLADALADAAQEVLAELPAHLPAEVQAEFAMTQARLHRGLIVSGDRFVATAAESAALRALLPDALAVEMEGAAVAQVCHDWGVPFAAVRTISDRADDAAHADFGRFVARVASPFSAAIVRRTLARL